MDRRQCRTRLSDGCACVRVCDRMGRRGMKRMHDDSLDGRGTGWLLFSISRKRTSEGFEWFSTWRWSFWMLGDVSRNLAWKRFALGYPIDRANNKFLKNLCVCSFRFELWLIYLLNRGTNYHRFRNVSVINPNLPAMALHRSSWIEESFVKLSKETTIDSRDKKFHEYLHLTFDLYADTEGQLFFLSSFLFSLLFENFVKETLDFLVKVKNYDRLDEPTSGWKRRYDRYKIVR